MSKTESAHESNLCGAYARSTGRPCRRLAMPNGRCDMHGGKNPIKTGLHTKQAKAERKEFNALMKAGRQTVVEMNKCDG